MVLCLGDSSVWYVKEGTSVGVMFSGDDLGGFEVGDESE